MRHIYSKCPFLFWLVLFTLFLQVATRADSKSGNKQLTCMAVTPIVVCKEADERAVGPEDISQTKVISAQCLQTDVSSSNLQQGQIEQSEQDSQTNKRISSSQPVEHRPKIALALGGGGARGAAHVGVLKVLEKEGIKVDLIAGTSMGAIVGGLYSAGVPLSTLECCFSNGGLMKSFMTVPLSFRLAASPLLILSRLVHHPYDGLYKGNKFRNYISKLMPNHQANIEDLKLPFRPVVLNVIDGKAYALSDGDLAYALQASSAVPGLRKPVQIGNTLYVDGGVVANLPVQQAKQMGADIVIAVNIDERVKDVPLDTFRKVGSVAERMVLLQLADNDAPQAALADIVIHPNVDGISLISTKTADGIRGMKEGELAAQSAIPAIKAKIAKVQEQYLQASE